MFRLLYIGLQILGWMMHDLSKSWCPAPFQTGKICWLQHADFFLFHNIHKGHVTKILCASSGDRTTLARCWLWSFFLQYMKYSLPAVLVNEGQSLALGKDYKTLTYSSVWNFQVFSLCNTILGLRILLGKGYITFLYSITLIHLPSCVSFLFWLGKLLKVIHSSLCVTPIRGLH